MILSGVGASDKVYISLMRSFLLDKIGDHRYVTFCEKTMQEQISEFDQRVGTIHEMDCTITDKDGNRVAKVWLLQIETEINHG